MAISDYTLSKLRAAQLARGLAAETEQARADREAAQNRANLSYLNALLQTGAQIPGMIGDIGAAQGAAGIQEATAGLSPGEIESLIPSGEVPVPETPISPAGTSAVSGLMATEPAPQIAPPSIPTEPIIPEGQKPVAEAPVEEKVYNRDAMIERALKNAIASSERAQQQTDVQRIFSPDNAPAVTPAELTKETKSISPSLAQQTIRPIGVEKPGEAIQTVTVPGLNMQVPVPSAKQVPAAATRQEPKREVLPSVPDVDSIRKEIEEINKDPFKVAQEQFIKKLNSYKPPKYKTDSADAADKIVEDTWKNKQPNPILNLLSFGQYNNNLENSKRLAKKLVKGEIENLRKQEIAGDRKQFIETAKLEAQQILILQKEQNEKRKEDLKVKVKTLDPDKALTKLQEYKEVNNLIEDLENTTRDMIRNKVPFPGGAEYEKVLADIKSYIAAPDQSKAANINVSLGALGVGTGAGGSIAIGDKKYDSENLLEAVKAIQNSDMDDRAKEFLSQQMLIAQKVGKAREGGRMTDADLRFYLDNLFITNAKNPSTLLKSFNRMKKVNANSQNDWLNIYNALYPEINLPFSTLSGEGFTQEELDAADMLRYYEISPETAAAIARARQTGSLAGVAAEGSAAVSGMLPKEGPKGAQPPTQPQRKRAAKPANPLD